MRVCEYNDLIKKIKETAEKDKKKKQKELKEVLSEEPLIKEWIQSMKDNAQNGRPERTIGSGLSAFVRYLEFLASGPVENLELTLEDLIREAKESPKGRVAKGRVSGFFGWIQGNSVENYRPTEQINKYNSARTVAHCRVRGFYTHIISKAHFGRWKVPKKQASDRMRSDRFFATNENFKWDLIKKNVEGKKVLNRDVFNKFFNKLRWRDQVILACFEGSCGQYPSDILELTVGDIRNPMNYIEGTNFVWDGTRAKSGEQMTYFFTKSTTKIVKQYCSNDRSLAADSDPLFVKSGGAKIDEDVVTQNFGNAFRSMVLGVLDHIEATEGLEKREEIAELIRGKQSPFSANRWRHIFNTVADSWGVPKDKVKRMQGHGLGQSEQYTEVSVEDLFESFQDMEEALERTDVVTTDYDGELETLRGENEALTRRLDRLESRLEAFFGVETGELMTDLQQTVEEHPEGFTDEEREQIHHAFEEE